MQQRCPNCGSPIAPGQRFCGGCGAQLSLACPYCRITVSPGTKFCPSCGASLGGGMPQQPGWGPQPGGMPPQQPGWGPQPGGIPPQQPGWGPQPGGMPQQPGWGQQQAWAPPAPKRQSSSSSRPFLVLLLFVLLIGLGFLTYKYTPLGETVLNLLKSSTGGTTTTPTVDTTKPVISNIEANAVPTTALITWSTDDFSSSQVQYGKTQEYDKLEPAVPDTDPTTGTSLGAVDHAVTLTGLEPNTLYHYRVKSKNAANLEAVSADQTFTTTTASEE